MDSHREWIDRRGAQVKDLEENAEYHAAKDEQGPIESGIRQLENRLVQAEGIDPSGASHQPDPLRTGRPGSSRCWRSEAIGAACSAPPDGR